MLTMVSLNGMRMGLPAGKIVNPETINFMDVSSVRAEVYSPKTDSLKSVPVVDPDYSHLEKVPLTVKFLSKEFDYVHVDYIKLSGAVQDCLIVMDEVVTIEGLPKGLPLTVTPCYGKKIVWYVSTYDLLLIQKHLVGKKLLASPYKLIAADVNNDGAVSISDMVELRSIILNPGLFFKNNTNWRYVDASYVFPDPDKPGNFPESITFQALEHSNLAEFRGIRIGDVSGTAFWNGPPEGEVRESAGSLSFSMKDALLEAGREYTIVVRAEDFQGVQGYQYTLEWDTDVLEFIQVEGLWAELGPSHFGLSRVTGGMLATSWHGSGPVTLDEGTPLYAITVRPLKTGRLRDAVRVTSRMVQAEAYDREDGLMEVALRFDGAPVPSEGFALYQNEPNPFRDLTVIGFQLPAPTTTTLRVYDVTGRMVREIKADYPWGYHEVTLTRAELLREGMLYYELETPTHRAMKRMLLVE